MNKEDKAERDKIQRKKHIKKYQDKNRATINEYQKQYRLATKEARNKTRCETYARDKEARDIKLKALKEEKAKNTIECQNDKCDNTFTQIYQGIKKYCSPDCRLEFLRKYKNGEEKPKSWSQKQLSSNEISQSDKDRIATIVARIKDTNEEESKQLNIIDYIRSLEQ